MSHNYQVPATESLEAEKKEEEKNTADKWAAYTSTEAQLPTT